MATITDTLGKTKTMQDLVNGKLNYTFTDIDFLAEGDIIVKVDDVVIDAQYYTISFDEGKPGNPTLTFNDNAFTQGKAKVSVEASTDFILRNDFNTSNTGVNANNEFWRTKQQAKASDAKTYQDATTDATASAKAYADTLAGQTYLAAQAWANQQDANHSTADREYTDERDNALATVLRAENSSTSSSDRVYTRDYANTQDDNHSTADRNYTDRKISDLDTKVQELIDSGVSQGIYRIYLYRQTTHGDPAPSAPTGATYDGTNYGSVPSGWQTTFFTSFNDAAFDYYESFTEYNPKDNSIGGWSTPFVISADTGGVGPIGRPGDQGKPGEVGPIGPQPTLALGTGVAEVESAVLYQAPNLPMGSVITPQSFSTLLGIINNTNAHNYADYAAPTTVAAFTQDGNYSVEDITHNGATRRCLVLTLKERLDTYTNIFFYVADATNSFPVPNHFGAAELSRYLPNTTDGYSIQNMSTQTASNHEGFVAFSDGDYKVYIYETGTGSEYLGWVNLDRVAAVKGKDGISPEFKTSPDWLQYFNYVKVGANGVAESNDSDMNGAEFTASGDVEIDGNGKATFVGDGQDFIIFPDEVMTKIKATDKIIYGAVFTDTGSTTAIFRHFIVSNELGAATPSILKHSNGSSLTGYSFDVRRNSDGRRRSVDYDVTMGGGVQDSHAFVFDGSGAYGYSDEVRQRDDSSYGPYTTDSNEVLRYGDRDYADDGQWKGVMEQLYTFIPNSRFDDLTTDEKNAALDGAAKFASKNDANKLLFTDKFYTRKEIDAKDADTLQAAKDYADGLEPDLTAYSTTVQVDSKDADTLQSAKDYADAIETDLSAYSTTVQINAKDEAIYNRAKQYTDDNAGSGVNDTLLADRKWTIEIQSSSFNSKTAAGTDFAIFYDATRSTDIVGFVFPSGTTADYVNGLFLNKKLLFSLPEGDVEFTPTAAGSISFLGNSQYSYRFEATMKFDTGVPTTSNSNNNYITTLYRTIDDVEVLDNTIVDVTEYSTNPDVDEVKVENGKIVLGLTDGSELESAQFMPSPANQPHARVMVTAARNAASQINLTATTSADVTETINALSNSATANEKIHAQAIRDGTIAEIKLDAATQNKLNTAARDGEGAVESLVYDMKWTAQANTFDGEAIPVSPANVGVSFSATKARFTFPNNLNKADIDALVLNRRFAIQFASGVIIAYTPTAYSRALVLDGHVIHEYEATFERTGAVTNNERVTLYRANEDDLVRIAANEAEIRTLKARVLSETKNDLFISPAHTTTGQYMAVKLGGTGTLLVGTTQVTPPEVGAIEYAKMNIAVPIAEWDKCHKVMVSTSHATSVMLNAEEYIYKSDLSSTTSINQLASADGRNSARVRIFLNQNDAEARSETTHRLEIAGTVGRVYIGTVRLINLELA